MSQTILCNYCVRNISSSYIDSEDGRCEYCKQFDVHRGNLISKVAKIQGKFLESLSKRKGKKYDCIVLVSGGKDSIMTLYKLKKDTDLRILAYTFDNGFESQEAIENIVKAVEKLEIDWLYDKPGFILPVLRTILKERIPYSICRFCAPIMINRGIKTAKLYGIPNIVTGWNKGQSDKEPSRFALWKIENKELHEIFKKYPHLKNIGLKEDENEALLKKLDIKVISPWIFEKRNTTEYMNIIQKELGWKIPKISYPKKSTNCILNFLQVILSRKYFGYTHYDCEESTLINYGETTKEKAIDLLDQDIDLKIIKKILKKLDLTLTDIGLTSEDLMKFSKFM